MKNVFDAIEIIRKQQEAIYPPGHAKVLEESKALQAAMEPYSAIKMAVQQASAVDLALENFSAIRKVLENQNSIYMPIRSVLEILNSTPKFGEIENLGIEPLLRITKFGIGSGDFSPGFSDDFSSDFLTVTSQPENDTLTVEVNLEKRVEVTSPAEMKIYLDGANKIKKIIAAMKSRKLDFDGITHADFEDLILELLRKKGFQAEPTKRTRDGGYDILALIKGPDEGSLKYLIECKHPRTSKKNIGVRVIREFTAVVDRHSANKGLIFTTTDFTKDAKKENALQGSRIDLKNYMNVMDWVLKYD